MPFGGLLIGGMALAGGVAGAMGDSSETTVNLPGSSLFERQLGKDLENQYWSLSDYMKGPQWADALGAQSSLADMLKRYSEGGYLPSQSDLNTSNRFAADVFAPQRLAMSQAFDDQTTQANRQAALMGRSMNDPILRAKLAQEQTRQSALLASEQGAFGAQYAQQMPLQRLGFAQDRAGVLQGLATQAMQNKLTLMGVGQEIYNTDRNFRLAQAGQKTESGGGFGGFLKGALAGAGAGMSAANSFGNAQAFQGAMGRMGTAPASTPPMGGGPSLTGYNYSGNIFAGPSTRTAIPTPMPAPTAAAPSSYRPMSPYGASYASPLGQPSQFSQSKSWWNTPLW